MQANVQAFCCRCVAADLQSRPQVAPFVSKSLPMVVPRLAIKRPQKLMYVVGSALSCTPLLSPLVSRKRCFLWWPSDQPFACNHN